MGSIPITENKVIFCLFDGSGIAGQPWAEAGYTVYCFNADGGDHGRYPHKIIHPNIIYVDAWIEPGFDPVVEGYPIPSLIIAFPPCTDMAVSGARHFKSKAEKDPDFQIKAANVAKVAADLAEKYGAEYCIENPVSVLSTLWRKCDYIFDPYEFGGYLPDDDQHPHYPEFIRGRDAYPKKTCLWVSEGFNFPEKLPVPVDDGFSTQYKKLGGKSEKTKTIRSLTPRGFARAVFKANRGGTHDKETGGVPS